MHVEGSIRAVNSQILDFLQNQTDSELSSAASLAKAKLGAKFELPESANAAQRRSDAWQRWITFDEGLSTRDILGPHWAKARLLIHEVLSNFHMGTLTFTNGSSFEPLGPFTSLACKLTADWTITADCFDTFARYSYWHRALKHAVKKRFKSYCKSKGLSMKFVNYILWNRFKDKTEPAYQIYVFKLHCIVTFVYGNRWSTVPKNNQKDRSICLEPLCNMLVQRAVGLGIRASLKEKLGIDLNFLADVHRKRISDPKVATIDLSDCSDAISMKLIRYLLPRKVLARVLACRSDMTLGPDDNFYVVKKVSSMGNGFTFDLMSLVLTALTRSLDQTSTVFGDDIICQSQVADEVVSNLQLAGFVVNLSKTNINTGFRESCGSYFTDTEGYLTIFDLRWLKTPHDLIVALNKVAILSMVYKGPFESLRARIWSCVPRALLGAATIRQVAHTGRPPSYDLDAFVRYGPLLQYDPPKRMLKSLRKICRRLHKNGMISVAIGYETTLSPAASSLKSTDWDLFFQYIHNCRLSRRVPRLVNKSSLVARVGEEQIGFTKALLSERK